MSKQYQKQKEKWKEQGKKELRAEIEKEIKNLRDMGSFLDNENGLFVRVEDIDDFEQKLIGTKEEK